MANQQTQLIDYVNKLADDTNSAMKGAELTDIAFEVYPSFAANPTVHIGELSIYIRFASDQPNFLTAKDRQIWQGTIRNLTQSIFGFELPATYSLMKVSITIEDTSVEGLTQLTPQKEALFRQGIDKIKRYAIWHIAAVKNYDAVKQEHEKSFQKYIAGLEKLIE